MLKAVVQSKLSSVINKNSRKQVSTQVLVVEGRESDKVCLFYFLGIIFITNMVRLLYWLNIYIWKHHKMSPSTLILSAKMDFPDKKTYLLGVSKWNSNN